MIARLAREEDKVALASFTCCDRSADYEAEVEDWVRAESWDWFSQGEEDDTHLILFVENESGHLLAVGAHESADWGRFINVLAVARDSQGRGIGLTAMVSLIEDCAQIAPGRSAMWNVHPRNHRSIRMSERVGADYTQPDHLLSFRLALPTLPGSA